MISKTQYAPICVKCWSPAAEVDGGLQCSNQTCEAATRVTVYAWGRNNCQGYAVCLEPVVINSKSQEEQDE